MFEYYEQRAPEYDEWYLGTGLFASQERPGWLEELRTLCALIAAQLADEIDRYVVMPGQALAYLTGKLEILRIRDEARQRLGPAFSLPAFHAAVLDHGSLPMPVLARSIADWLDGVRVTRPGSPG